MKPTIYREVVPKKSLLELLKLLKLYNSFKVNGGNWAPVTDDVRSYSYFDHENQVSKVKKIYQQFSFGLWGSDNEVEDEIKNLLYPLQVLHSSINTPQLDKNCNALPSTGYCTRYTLNHFPVGGGYLGPHTDDYNILNQLQALLYITEKPKYYSQGDLLVKTSHGIFTDSDFNPRMGDVLVFDPQLEHQVSAIDPNSAMKKFDYESGRVTAVFVPMKLNKD